jgi:GntR family transcriptional regulator / MocR family aminotransferase
MQRSNMDYLDESNLGSTFVLPPRPAGMTLTRWLYEEFRGAILGGKLKRGWALPATRDLAERARISRHIVVNVYAQLTAEGYIDGAVGRGTFVRQDVPDDFDSPATQSEPVRTSAEPRPEGYEYPARPFCLTQPSLDEFPLEVWKRVASRAARRFSLESLQGGHWAGLRRLRTVIASYLAVSRGVSTAPENIVIVSGVQQGLDLLTRLVVDPGDPVWLEDPCYIGARDAFQQAGARIVAVPVDQDGLDPSIGRRLCRKPKAVYLTPAHQFGIGTTLSLDRRLALLSMCQQEGTVLIEDDYDSEFRFLGRSMPAMKGMSGADSSFLLGTFNKILFPSLRLGYMVAPDRWIEPLLKLRYRIDRYPPSLAQQALADFIDEGHFTRHLRRMRQVYGERRDALARFVGQYLAGTLQIPTIHAGLNTPAYLINAIPATTASKRARGEGIEAWPIDRYTIKRQDLNALMLGFAAFTPKQIREGVVSLAKALRVY